MSKTCPKTGKCQNCKQEEELEQVIIDNKKKWFCDACADGYQIELKENRQPPKD